MIPCRRRSVGETVPLLSSPRFLGDERLGPELPGRGGPELAAGKDPNRLDAAGRALFGDGEFGEPVDLVAPQIDPDRSIRRARINVDDGAPNRNFTPMFDLPFSPVAGQNERLDEIDRIEPIAGTNHDGRPTRFGVDPLDERPSGGDNQRGRTVAAQPMQHLEALTHGLDPGRDPFEGKGFPRREVQDSVGTEDGGHVGCEPLRFGLSRGTDEDGTPVRCRDKTGEHEGPSRVGDGNDRFTTTEGGVE